MGKLAVIKTRPTTSSVEDYINSVGDEGKRKDSFLLLQIMQKATNEKPTMWGTSIIGFGNKRYKSPKTDREVDSVIIGFSPRKTSLTLYGLDIKRNANGLKMLGKHKTGVGCLYVNKLADIDIKLLTEMITAAAKIKQ